MHRWIQPHLPFIENLYDTTMAIQHNPCRMSRTWNERKATIGLIRSDLTSSLKKTENGMPIVKSYCGSMPSSLIGLNRINGAYSNDCWLHGFSDDCILERLWNRPYYYIKKISNLGGMLSPDFSLYLNMSPIEKKMNIFRKNALSQIAQNKGINVIYTLCWAEYDSLEYCVDGV